MTKNPRPVAIVGGVRTPFTRSFAQYSRIGNKDLMAATLRELVKKYHLEGEILGDVAVGSVMKNADDWNLAREALLDSGLDPRTPGYDVTRACGTSLETTWQLALKIANYQMDVAIAGGTDTNSDITGTLTKELSWILMDAAKAKSFPERMKALMQIRPGMLKPRFPGVVEPRTGKSMGDHTELMVKEWGISRQEQDQLAYESHQKAAKAYAEGFYNDLVFEFSGLKKDSFVRADTTLEKLAKLKPAFDKSAQGTLTAGNSTPLTDGAAAVLLATDEYAQRKNLPVLAHFVDAEAAAVDFVGGDGLLMAPATAVDRMLKRNNLKLQDFDFYEIHEAFAGQVLCTLKAWETKFKLGTIERSKMNFKGGSLAVGHPFAATGARIVASLAKTLAEKGSGRGLISICTAGGMGVCAILERK